VKTGSRKRPARIAALAASSLALATMAVVGRGAGASTGSAPAGSGAIGFASPVVVDPVHTYGEPDIRFGPGGGVYNSGPWGTGTQRSIWNQSTDGGRTFHPLHSPPIVSAAQSDTTVPCPPGQLQCPGGGDTEIAIDHTNKVYYADLAALVTLKTATWVPASRTMKTGLIDDPSQNANGIDRQWFALWDPPKRPAGYSGPLPVNYLLYLEAVLGSDCGGNCEAASYSTNGIDYSAPTAVATIGLDGNATIDQQTGTVLEAIGYSSESDVGVAIYTRDPSDKTNPALKNVQMVKIADLPSGNTARALFPVIAMDSARNAYVVWPTRGSGSESQDPKAWQIWYSYASASSGWKQWSAPRQVSSPPSNTNVMPWVTAGKSGRIAVVWYGTGDADHNPSTEDVHQSWDVYLAMITGANSRSPVITQTRVTKHPMHYGTICLEGTGCILSQGNRNVADFFQDTTDPKTGAVVITYNDTSNELRQEFIGEGDGTLDHRGAPVVMDVRQNGGVGLFGTNVSGPADSLTDSPANDAAFDPLYSTTDILPLDITSAGAAASGDNVVFTVTVNDMSNLASAFSATGAGALDYVIRWTGPPVDDPQTGTRNPIYFAAMETLPGGASSFFAGQALAVELCSVSGCFPHIIDYPRPPRGGAEVSGAVNGNTITITVPRSVIDSPPDGSVLESLGAYTFARSKSAALEFTNAEGEGGVTPIEVDGVCCVDAVMKT
jgi:hypothetical protein